MKTRDLISVLVISILLLGALAYFYDKATAVDPNNHATILRQIEELQTLDAKLTRDVLLVRSGLLRYYDPINATLISFRQGLDRLRDLSPGTNHECDRILEALDSYEVNLEDFKSSNAVLRNSLMYVTTLIKEMTLDNHVELESSSANLIAGLATEIMVLQRNPSLEAYQRLNDSLNRLQTLELADLRGHAIIDSIIKHGHTILDKTRSIDQTLSDMFFRSRLRDPILTLQTQYLKQHAVHEDHAQLFRAALFVSSVLLLLLVLMVVIRLIRTTQNLQATIAELRNQKFALDEHAIVSITDPKGDITYVNDKFCQSMGYEREELIGKNHRLLKSGRHTAEFYSQLWSTILAGQVWHAEMFNRTRQGQSILLDTTIVPFLDAKGQAREYVAIRTDITARYKAEVELSAYRDRLQDLVEERTAELSASNRELESFSYSVSHDLRAPLRSIDGFSQALIDEYQGLLDEKGRDYLDRISKAAQRMGTLIDGLLVLSRVTRGDLQRQRINLSAIAEEIITTLQTSEQDRTVEVSIQPDIYVVMDSRLARLVLENLLSNAWKFSSKNAHAKIEFARNEQGEFWVGDNGVGFDTNYVNKLFKPFQRLHHTSEFEGTGIGLATVQRIVARHGGTVRVECEPGVMTRFYVSIPEQSSHTLEASIRAD